MVAESAALIRLGGSRGTTKTDWLHSRHSFSFGEYHDASWLGFRSLRVINDDIVAPGAGFGMHGHRDMEIVTVVLSGQLEHRDSLGNGAVLGPGEVQAMSAGTGVRHSEFNPSKDQPAHFLQIWIQPRSAGLAPSYAQRRFDEPDRRNCWCRIAGPPGPDGALQIAQDADVFRAAIPAGAVLSKALGAGRGAWLHVIEGEVSLSGRRHLSGDAVGLVGVSELHIAASQPSELLLFEV